MTSRTIRSYHTRGLLQPPERVGRAPYYGPEHLTRLRLVSRLQRSGLPLDAVRALLEPDLVFGQLLPYREIAAALRADPALTRDLVACGVLSQRPDGALAVRSARAVLAAGALCRVGLPIRVALRMLVDAIAQVRSHAEATLTGLRATLADLTPTCDPRPDEVLELAVEVSRLCLTGIAHGRLAATGNSSTGNSSTGNSSTGNGSAGDRAPGLIAPG